MNELDAVAARPATLVQVSPTGQCHTESLILQGAVAIGDHVPCNADDCTVLHQVYRARPVSVLLTAEIATAETGAEATAPSRAGPRSQAASPAGPKAQR